jgi:hypothetical protein
MSIAPYEADPFPFELPKVTRSGAAHIRFGGEGYEKLVFGPPDAILPIFSVTAGTTFVLTAAGFRPGMQVLLAADGLPNRYVLSPTWEGYGKIGIPIPLGIQGVHVLTHVRYQHDGPTGPFWGPWRQVPVPQPHFFVHP